MIAVSSLKARSCQCDLQVMDQHSCSVIYINWPFSSETAMIPHEQTRPHTIYNRPSLKHNVKVLYPTGKDAILVKTLTD